LTLSGTEPGIEGVRALAHASAMPCLEWLELAENGLGPEVGEILVSAPLAARLRALWLSGNQLGTAGAAALTSWPTGSPLRSLSLRANRLGTGAKKALRERFGKGVTL
jgi:hypothetical protein